MEQQSLLVELGTEELPPKALRKISQSLHDEFVAGLHAAGIEFGDSTWYATPRRLAVLVRGVARQQPDRTVEIKGPAVKAAFTAAGAPTPAALGWAKANGIDLTQAERKETPKGAWLTATRRQRGARIETLVPGLFAQALKKLPIPKLMRWGDKKEAFIRPVHTLCMLYGSELIPGTMFGVDSARTVKGHRFLGQRTVELRSADDYVSQMATEGAVNVDYEGRKDLIRTQVAAVATAVGGKADLDDALLEEVTAIVESPHVYKAEFEPKFLRVPAEALVCTMKNDQKYFPIYDGDGHLKPVFAFVSNINPEDPSSLIAGNERVVRPRLADAEFFFTQDRKRSLEDFYPQLTKIVYQKDLGTLADRTAIVTRLTAYLAGMFGADAAAAERAAHLSKCDLATTMVTEFTETQGVMGMHYALLDGEQPAVAEAIVQAYQPRFAGDAVPTGPVQVSLSLAEKIVTLTGIFGVGLLPKGDKDPFGLRRAAIGIIRIAVENRLRFDLSQVLAQACSLLGDKLRLPDTAAKVKDYVYSRLRAYYQEQGVPTAVFLAVLQADPREIYDFDLRIRAVAQFRTMPAAADLVTAYKRIANILRKEQRTDLPAVDPACLREPAECELATQLAAVGPVAEGFYAAGDYAAALIKLAGLREAVDRFFEQVMVAVPEERIKLNRLSMLARIQALFARTADISLLYGE